MVYKLGENSRGTNCPDTNLEAGTQWRRASVAILRDLAVAKLKGRSGPRTYEDNFSDCLLEI